MVLTIIGIIILLCLLILALFGPLRKKKGGYVRSKDSKTFSDYGINEDGELEQVKKDDNVH